MNCLLCRGLAAYGTHGYGFCTPVPRPTFVASTMGPPIEAWTLKRAAWAYGCAKAGSAEEAQLLEVLKQVFTREVLRAATG